MESYTLSPKIVDSQIKTSQFPLKIVKYEKKLRKMWVKEECFYVHRWEMFMIGNILKWQYSSHWSCPTQSSSNS